MWKSDHVLWLWRHCGSCAIVALHHCAIAAIAAMWQCAIVASLLASRPSAALWHCAITTLCHCGNGAWRNQRPSAATSDDGDGT